MAEVFISIPHAGLSMPPELSGRLLPHVDEGFLLSQSDMFTDRIYEADGARTLIYPWSRFTADPNRFEGQTSEGGIVPTTDFDERPLYRAGLEPSLEEQRDLVRSYHQPYHSALADALASEEVCFFIDGHSMMATSPRRSPDYGQRRPDACLSNCGDMQGEILPGRPLTCSPEQTRHLASRLSHWLQAIPAPEAGPAHAVEGSVRVNDPFMGGHTVRTHAQLSEGLPGLQFELNQRLWVSEGSLTPLPGRVEWLREVISRVVEEIVAQAQTRRATAV
ncbi:MAG: N-formylglutamate amidohydrolase [Myxococcota bacterium]|nr:N-formylglutamate amidohydrolase [Myxococcota bacterium]